MGRIILILVVLAIGYDAIAHAGHYTRGIWENLVGLAGAASDRVEKL